VPPPRPRAGLLCSGGAVPSARRGTTDALSTSPSYLRSSGTPPCDGRGSERAAVGNTTDRRPRLEERWWEAQQASPWPRGPIERRPWANSVSKRRDPNMAEPPGAGSSQGAQGKNQPRIPCPRRVQVPSIARNPNQAITSRIMPPPLSSLAPGPSRSWRWRWRAWSEAPPGPPPEHP
jgi:hypothetical protein